MHKPLLLAGVLLAALLAGCSGGTDDGTPTVQDIGKGELAEGTGGIAGIVIDDRYRPIPQAKLFLMPLGLITTADAIGQFEFRDLEPGSYQLRIDAEGHEGSPVAVDVVAGEFAEVEAPARRIFSQDGTIITTQYSVFIDCSWETPVLGGTNGGCSLDQSGDSTRGYYMTNMEPATANATTYMVTEVQFNQVGDYTVTVRHIPPGRTSLEAHHYAEGDLLKGDYVRLQLQANATNDRPGENQGRNVPWDPSKEFQTIVFPHGELYGELHKNVCPPDVPGVVDFTCMFGIGVDLGVKARIVQSVFLGTPDVDVETYAVLKPA